MFDYLARIRKFSLYEKWNNCHRSSENTPQRKWYKLWKSFILSFKFILKEFQIKINFVSSSCVGLKYRFKCNTKYYSLVSQRRKRHLMSRQTQAKKHTYTHTHTRIHTYTYTRTHEDTHTYTYTHTNTHTNMSSG